MSDVIVCLNYSMKNQVCHTKIAEVQSYHTKYILHCLNKSDMTINIKTYTYNRRLKTQSVFIGFCHKQIYTQQQQDNASRNVQY